MVVRISTMVGRTQTMRSLTMRALYTDVHTGGMVGLGRTVAMVVTRWWW